MTVVPIYIEVDEADAQKGRELVDRICREHIAPHRSVVSAGLSYPAHRLGIGHVLAKPRASRA